MVIMHAPTGPVLPARFEKSAQELGQGHENLGAETPLNAIRLLRRKTVS